MTLTLLLPWFPIVLAVGVGGRMLGRGRGFALGMACAMFWIVLVQASIGTGMWRQPSVVVTIVIGAAAIFLMGGWAGQMSLEDGENSKFKVLKNREFELRTSHSDLSGAATPAPDLDRRLDRLTAVIRQFDDWLVEHRDDADPWPAFGEFIRGALFQCCRATHVKPFRLLSEEGELIPLSPIGPRSPDPPIDVGGRPGRGQAESGIEVGDRREPDPPSSTLTKGGTRGVSARQGILGHVVTTGRSYVSGDRSQGELIAELAQTTGPIGPIGPIVWCFAVTQGAQRLGVVTVGHLDPGGAGIPADNMALLRAAEQVIAQCWSLLTETACHRIAGQQDPDSGLHNRTAFLRAAQQSLRESYAQGEPVGVAVIAVEGMRDLNDAGRWEVADELIHEVADTLRRKIRMDDRLGRFDGSRFIWLLRRVDAELASLIVKQVMSRLTTLCGDGTRWGTSISVRCGVVGSGTENPNLRTLVSHALVQSRRARLEQVTIAGELDAQAPDSACPRPGLPPTSIGGSGDRGQAATMEV